MARARSHLHSTVRGSIAGVTYAGSPYSPITIRQRVNVTNRRTEYQLYTRNACRSAAAQWRQLLPDYQIYWTRYASTCWFDGPIKRYQVPGRQLAIGQYVVTAVHNALGLTPAIALSLQDAPSLDGRLQLANLEIIPPAAGNTGFRIQMLNLNQEPCYLYANRSPRLNSTRYRYIGPFIPLTTNRILCATPPAITRLPFYGLDDDAWYFVRIGIYSVGTSTCKRRMGDPITLRAYSMAA